MGRRVLLIEDDAGEQELIAEVLSIKGYEVDRASLGNEGLALLEKNFYDLVICDVRLPDLSGLEVLSRVKERDRELGVIVITAYPSIPNAVRAIQSGAYDYLQKPLNVDHLEHVLQRYFDYYELIRENRRLRQELKKAYSFDSLVGKSAAMREVFERIQLVANSKATVLITGESGTGKELVARAIHYNSPRRNRPFIKTNCAALPEGLIESELFGHEKGAFTGAYRARKGRFELADGGTLLLDEISEIGIGLQAKLLRVLQEKEFERVGTAETVKVDVRVIATTNRDLLEEVRAGRFREDLYYRLNVVPIHLPPLRERKEDIPLLVQHFIRKYAEENGKHVEGISEQALELMMRYHWPGNVRELENAIEQAVVLTTKPVLEARLFSFIDTLTRNGDAFGRGLDLSRMTLRELEKVAILKALQETGGNRTHAARRLGISVRTLRNKLREYRYQDEGAFEAA
ncbi:MAG: sigma-54 dependent transcriptional regulator [candidate division KSB1 bacterium]|nr:sigma-54 dependent transcriptional regulator [candidate division KSB1 bacterium]